MYCDSRNQWCSRTGISPSQRLDSSTGDSGRPGDREAGGQSSSMPGHHCDYKLCAPRTHLASARPLDPTTVVATVSPAMPVPTHWVSVMATRLQEGLRLSLMVLGEGHYFGKFQKLWKVGAS